MVGTAGTFTSCKDYDDDIESLDNRVSAVEKLVSDLQAKSDAGSVITGVDKTEEDVYKRQDGKEAIKNNKDLVFALLHDAEDNTSYNLVWQIACSQDEHILALQFRSGSRCTEFIRSRRA